MQKRHWRDLGFFVLGTFVGGPILAFFGSIFGGAVSGARRG